MLNQTLRKKIPRVVPNTLSQKGATGLSLYNMEAEKVFAIDGFAREVFLLINGKRSVDQIIEKILKKNELSKTRFEADAFSFFKWLEERKLVSLK